jgi:NHS family xanthosine MFS transporter
MNPLKIRLIIMNFLQFFIWGSWLITIGAYWFQTLPTLYPDQHWSGTAFGALFSTMGWAALVMPSLLGIIADKWINAERLLGLSHLAGAICLFILPTVDNPNTMFWVLLANMAFYMPTISLAITVAYSSLKREGADVIKEYPPIRVWGTIGFIVAMWTVSILQMEKTAGQFYLAAAAAVVLGIYAFTLPKCPPEGKGTKSTSLAESLGLNAFSLFKDTRITIFFVFSMLLGAALQLTNAYGDTFLHDFAKIPEFQNLLAVKYPAMIMSISQMSETLFILAIPFFMKRFGIKNVMLMSMFAWVLRFGLFAFGDPAGGLWMIVLSCIVYGMAFDFFNISGSLFLETQTKPKIRASAQGLFMMMTNGVGAILGSMISGWVIQQFFTNPDNSLQWKAIWLVFAGYALIIGVLFIFLFNDKGLKAKDLESVAISGH